MLTGAQVIVDGLPMTIAVPAGPDVKRRICTYARVMAHVYAAPTPKCAWCEQEIEGASLFFSPEDGGEVSGPYCSVDCWLAAS